MGAKLLCIEPRHQAYDIYSANTHDVAESRNVVSIETPSEVLSPPIN